MAELNVRCYAFTYSGDMSVKELEKTKQAPAF